MSGRTRTLVAVAAGVALLGAAGASGGELTRAPTRAGILFTDAARPGAREGRYRRLPSEDGRIALAPVGARRRRPGSALGDCRVRGVVGGRPLPLVRDGEAGRLRALSGRFRCLGSDRSGLDRASLGATPAGPGRNGALRVGRLPGLVRLWSDARLHDSFRSGERPVDAQRL